MSSLLLIEGVRVMRFCFRHMVVLHMDDLLELCETIIESGKYLELALKHECKSAHRLSV
jgi:hypothetical protein